MASESSTLSPAPNLVGTNQFEVEYSSTLATGAWRKAVKVSEFPRIATLRNYFASVVVQRITAEVRQDTLAGTDTGCISTRGHIYVALIPTLRNTDAESGSTREIVNNVPNKMTFPISTAAQANETFEFNLTGFELDLAQDPRRGAGIVAWIGNSGITTIRDREDTDKSTLPIATVTWRIQIECTGTTSLW